jgi:membrane-bound lytic murein transglycosylase D
MKRPTVLYAGLLTLGACATGLPPAPTAAPVGLATQDSLLALTDLRADAEVLDALAAADPDERVIPEFDGSQVTWDIDVRTYAEHPRVRYYLSYFQGAARSRMAVFLERGARYESMIRTRFEAEGLPTDLGYLALIESGYSSDAVSRSYAVGMWQFMRPTGMGYGMRVDSWVDERRDMVKATDAAARHLSHLRDRFGSLYLAAAAYNAGAGKVSRSLGRLQWADTTVTDSAADAELLEEITSDAAFFRLAGTDLLTLETQDYVPKLIAAAIIAKQPERFGFAVPQVPPFSYDSIVVSDATGLDVIARLAGVSVAEIRDLNPQYLRLATPPRSVMTVRVPTGTGPVVEAGYTDLKPSERVRYLTHVVRNRETLSGIAAHYRIPAAEIRASNPKLKGKRPASGTRLVIPTVAIPSALAVRAAGSRSAALDGSAARTHRVRRGETLSGIAVRYRVSLRALRRANAIRDDDYVRAGMRLRIPG